MTAVAVLLLALAVGQLVAAAALWRMQRAMGDSAAECHPHVYRDDGSGQNCICCGKRLPRPH